ncbi:MAG: two-component sensor histidine kinase, partial [Albidovulum sp.]
MSDASRRVSFWHSVRTRILVIALLPALILLPMVLVYTVKSWIDRLDDVLIDKVAGELTIAHQHLAGLLNGRQAGIEALGQSASFVAAQENGSALTALLEARRIELGLDFLYFVAADSPADAARWPVVAAALQGRAGAEIDIFSGEDLAWLSPALAER